MPVIGGPLSLCGTSPASARPPHNSNRQPGMLAVCHSALGSFRTFTPPARPSRTVVAFPRLSSRSSPRSLLMGKQDEKPAKKVKAAEDAPAKKTKAQSKAEGMLGSKCEFVWDRVGHPSVVGKLTCTHAPGSGALFPSHPYLPT